MARKSIESDEMLQELCDWFLLCIAERKKKARKVKDVRTRYCEEKYYVINSSRKDHIGWVFLFDSRTDTWKHFDCVICGCAVCGSDCVCAYYWLNNFDRVEVKAKINRQNETYEIYEFSIRVDDYEYEYVSTKDDTPRKRNILSLLVSKLNELFED